MKINKESECEVVKKKLSKNQKDWTDYFNGKGQKMISAPDVYKVAKEESKELIESLKMDFRDGWLVTSTRIVYNADNLNAEIIHDAESKFVKPKKISVSVPVLSGEAKKSPGVEKYLQALFDTEDEIIKVLKRFGKDKKIYLWTPSLDSRKDRMVRSVVLGFGNFNRFLVDGNNWIDFIIGFSRGVLVDSAKQTKKTRRNEK